jgi:hypothetical protein
VNSVDLTMVHLIRGHEADPGMVMVVVVPIEEAAAEGFGVFDAAKAFGEAGLILQGLEVAFGERVVPRLRRGRLLDVCGRLCVGARHHPGSCSQTERLSAQIS